MMSDPQPNGMSWFPYAFGLVQTIVTSVLGFVAKLIRDVRADLSGVQKDMNDIQKDQSKTQIRLEEAEKRERLRAEELERRLNRLEDRRRGKDEP